MANRTAKDRRDARRATKNAEGRARTGFAATINRKLTRQNFRAHSLNSINLVRGSSGAASHFKNLNRVPVPATAARRKQAANRADPSNAETSVPDAQGH